LEPRVIRGLLAMMVFRDFRDSEILALRVIRVSSVFRVLFQKALKDQKESRDCQEDRKVSRGLSEVRDSSEMRALMGYRATRVLLGMMGLKGIRVLLGELAARGLLGIQASRVLLGIWDFKGPLATRGP